MNKNKIKIFFLIGIFLLALGIRLLFVPSFAHPDINCFQGWAYSIAKFGLLNIYERPVGCLVDYFPNYLYILNLIGFIYQKFFSLDFELNTSTLIFLLKLPAIIFDLLTAGFIFYLLRKQFKLKFIFSLLILIFYLFNPGLIYNSAYWGQIDAIHTFFILLSLFFITQNKFSFSWIFLTIALFLKLQTIIFFPLLFFLNFQKEKTKNLIKNIGFAIITALIICFPFLLGGKIFQVIKIPFILSTAYPYLSVNAFNFWWLFYPDLPGVVEKYVLLSDQIKFLGLIPYFLIGFSLFCLAYFFTLKNLLKNPSPKLIYLSAAFITFVFFMLPTNVHERYLYSLFPLMVLTLGKEKKLLFIYFLLSFSYFGNLVAATPFRNFLPFLNLSIPSSWPFVFLNIFCFFYFLYYLFTHSYVIRRKE